MIINRFPSVASYRWSYCMWVLSLWYVCTPPVLEVVWGCFKVAFSRSNKKVFEICQRAQEYAWSLPYFAVFPNATFLQKKNAVYSAIMPFSSDRILIPLMPPNPWLTVGTACLAHVTHRTVVRILPAFSSEGEEIWALCSVKQPSKSDICYLWIYIGNLQLLTER